MLDAGSEATLWALFLSAFVSSTLAPGGSEAVLAYLASQPEAVLVVLLLVASVGNTLGALTTFALGEFAAKKYPLQEHLSPKYQKGVARVTRWGPWTLLLSWLPIVGDALCFSAGWLRLNFMTCLIAIAVGKTVRYSLVILLISL